MKLFNLFLKSGHSILRLRCQSHLKKRSLSSVLKLNGTIINTKLQQRRITWRPIRSVKSSAQTNLYKKFSLLVMAETWRTDQDHSTTFIQGYQQVIKFRQNGKIGGM